MAAELKHAVAFRSRPICSTRCPPASCMLDAQLCVDLRQRRPRRTCSASRLNQARGRPHHRLPCATPSRCCRYLERARAGRRGRRRRELALARRGRRRSRCSIARSPKSRSGGHRHAPAARARRHHAAPAHLARERPARAARRQPPDGSPARARDQKSARRPARRGAAARARAARPALKEYTQRHHQRGRPADRAGRLACWGPGARRAKQLVNMHELCEHVFHLLRGEAPAGVAIERDYDPSLPNAMLDRNQHHPGAAQRGAQRAAGARRAARAGRIVLRTRARTQRQHRLGAPSPGGLIQVEDNGPGVPRGAARTIFYPLVTGRAERHRPRAGGRAGSGDAPRRHHRIRERAGPHRVHTAICPWQRRHECEAAACLAGRRRRLHPLGAGDAR